MENVPEASTLPMAATGTAPPKAGTVLGGLSGVNPRAEIARLAKRREELKVCDALAPSQFGSSPHSRDLPPHSVILDVQHDLEQLELQIYNYEGTYLKESPYGNVVRGWTAYKFVFGARLFVLSSPDLLPCQQCM